MLYRIVTYNIYGVKGIELTNEEPLAVNDEIIESFCFSIKLDKLYVKIRKGVLYDEVFDYINEYATNLFVSLVMRNDIIINNPRIELDRSGSISVSISVKLDISKVENNNEGLFCSQILSNCTRPTMLNKYIEDAIFLLRIEDQIIKFMGLYNIIMELLTEDGEKLRQKSVINFFLKKGQEYGVKLHQSSNTKSNEFEDELTKIRNDIAHQNRLSNYFQVLDIQDSITPNILKTMFIVINDLSQLKEITTAHNTQSSQLRLRGL